MKTTPSYLKTALRRRGYSEKAIKEISKWYGYSETNN